MTNAEAIETLRANYPDACYEQLREAVDAAIEVLKAQGVAGDTISRQAAIEAAMRDVSCIRTHEFNAGATRAANRIKQLPPAEPKRIRGKWIYCEDSTADCVDGYRCDKCGFFVPWDYQHKSIDYIKDYNFCPNCGEKKEVTE